MSSRLQKSKICTHLSVSFMYLVLLMMILKNDNPKKESQGSSSVMVFRNTPMASQKLAKSHHTLLLVNRIAFENIEYWHPTATTHDYRSINNVPKGHQPLQSGCCVLSSREKYKLVSTIGNATSPPQPQKATKKRLAAATKIIKQQ